MKKSEIATIVFIAITSSMVAFGISSTIPFLTVPEEGRKVDTFKEISSEVAEPNKEIFNDQAINPTVTIQSSSSSD